LPYATSASAASANVAAAVDHFVNTALANGIHRVGIHLRGGGPVFAGQALIRRDSGHRGHQCEYRPDHVVELAPFFFHVKGEVMLGTIVLNLVYPVVRFRSSSGFISAWTSMAAMPASGPYEDTEPQDATTARVVVQDDVA
jgi:hypothetical protein